MNYRSRPMKKDLRIAAVVSHCPVGCKQETIERMAVWTARAKQEGAEMVCFPEMNVTGYMIGPDVAKEAEAVPGFVSSSIGELSRKQGMVILAGIAETDSSSTIYASHMVVKPDGGIGIYRKLHLAPPERGVFSAGSRIPVFELHGMWFGIQLCYDAHFPELSTRMALSGVDAIFMPHASPKGTPVQKYRSWMRHLPARAFDNAVYIIACNQTGDNGKGLYFPGVALAFGPSGDVVSEFTDSGEGMILVDLKTEDLHTVRRHNMRYFLPNRREDLGTLGMDFHQKPFQNLV